MWIMRFNKIIEQLAMQRNCAWLWIVYLNKWVHDHTWGMVGNLICYSRNLGFSCSSYACLFYWQCFFARKTLKRNCKWTEQKLSKFVLSDSMACSYFAMVVLLPWSFNTWSPPEIGSSRSDNWNGETNWWDCIFEEESVLWRFSSKTCKYTSSCPIRFFINLWIVWEPQKGLIHLSPWLIFGLELYNEINIHKILDLMM